MSRLKILLTIFFLSVTTVSVTLCAAEAVGLPSFVMTVGAEDSLPHFSDEEVWQRGVSISFQVNKTNISPTDPGYRSLIYALQHVPEGYSFCRLLVIRGSASPEGSAEGNARLAHGRAQALVDSLSRYVELPKYAIEERYISEDYSGLAHLVENSSFEYRQEVADIIRQSTDMAEIKDKLRKLDGGKAWQRLLHEFFPLLRANRVVMVISHKPMPVPEASHFPDIQPARPGFVPAFAVPATIVEVPVVEQPRRELIALKTNLLLDAAYVPQYGWCPMPNIELEYLPRGGHWTFGGSFDMPWWKSSAYNRSTETSTGTDHKFFEARNYQLYARWYWHNGKGADGFHGFYVYPYIGAAVYGIGFKADKGWEGEAYHGGVGIGWKIPLNRLFNDEGRRTKGSHWYLELGIQGGGLYTRYDPYRFGNPRTGDTSDGRYYYKYVGNPSLFKKRDHSKWYLGPTRASITIGLDIIYRHRAKCSGSPRGGQHQQPSALKKGGRK